MSKQKLNLVQRAARQMAQASARAPEVMRRELFNAGTGCGPFDDFPDNLRRHSVSPDSAGPVDRPEHSTVRDLRGFCPCVKSLLYPERNRNGANVASLTNQV